MDKSSLYIQQKKLLSLIILCIFFGLPSLAFLIPGSERGEPITASQHSYRDLCEERDVYFARDELIPLGEYAVNETQDKNTGRTITTTEHHYVVAFVDKDNILCYAALLVDKKDPRWSQASALEEFDLHGYYQCKSIDSRSDELPAFYDDATHTLHDTYGVLGTDTRFVLTYQAGTAEEYTQLREEEKRSAESLHSMGIVIGSICAIGIIYAVRKRRKLTKEIREQQAWQAQFICQQDKNL